MAERRTMPEDLKRKRQDAFATVHEGAHTDARDVVDLAQAAIDGFGVPCFPLSFNVGFAAMNAAEAGARPMWFALDSVHGLTFEQHAQAAVKASIMHPWLALDILEHATSHHGQTAPLMTMCAVIENTMRINLNLGMKLFEEHRIMARIPLQGVTTPNIGMIFTDAGLYQWMYQVVDRLVKSPQASSSPPWALRLKNASKVQQDMLVAEIRACQSIMGRAVLVPQQQPRSLDDVSRPSADLVERTSSALATIYAALDRARTARRGGERAARKCTPSCPRMSGRKQGASGLLTQKRRDMSVPRSSSQV